MNDTSKPVKLYLNQELFNSLVSVLDVYERTESDNLYCSYAIKLKEKIMTYSRLYQKDDEVKTAVNFYPDEAAMLIKLLLIYNSTAEKPSEDFFEILRCSKLKIS